MLDIRVGTCSWSSPGLRGAFYPRGIAAGEMIKFYAQHFRLVEVDSTYYHLPNQQTVKNWAERAPDGFLFDVKAFKEMTRHVRQVEPAADTFHRFASALEPLHATGKLGAVLFQFPPWFKFSEKNVEYIEVCQELMKPYRLAIEFRHGSWLRQDVEERTLRFLRDRGLSYVSVDEPQFPGNTVPPIAIATSQVAVVRFHGRNRASWFKRDISVEERFNYLYTDSELEEWVPKIRSLAEATTQVHVLMNNCYQDFAVRNARDIARLLGQPIVGQQDGNWPDMPVQKRLF